jgi:hypothetical protein
VGLGLWGKVWRGVAMFGGALLGTARILWLSSAGWGWVRNGVVWQGIFGDVWQCGVVSGKVMYGGARIVWLCEARQVQARLGEDYVVRHCGVVYG